MEQHGGGGGASLHLLLQGGGGGRASPHFLFHVITYAASRWGYKNRERQSNTENSLRAVHPGKDAITPPSVALHLTGSRQGNRGPPLPPPLIGCLCWLRHTGLAGPGGPAPKAGRWRRLLSCRSAAESQPLAWRPPPLRALGNCWMAGVATSVFCWLVSFSPPLV